MNQERYNIWGYFTSTITSSQMLMGLEQCDWNLQEFRLVVDRDEAHPLKNFFLPFAARGELAYDASHCDANTTHPFMSSNFSLLRTQSITYSKVFKDTLGRSRGLMMTQALLHQPSMPLSWFGS